MLRPLRRIWSATVRVNLKDSSLFYLRRKMD
jgi:hypothetical protein